MNDPFIIGLLVAATVLGTVYAILGIWSRPQPKVAGNNDLGRLELLRIIEKGEHLLAEKQAALEVQETFGVEATANAVADLEVWFRETKLTIERRLSLECRAHFYDIYCSDQTAKLLKRMRDVAEGL